MVLVKNSTKLLEYIQFYKTKYLYGDCSIRVCLSLDTTYQDNILAKHFLIMLDA